MKITSELSKERETLAFTAFQPEPTRSVAEVQEDLVRHSGFKMNLARIYAIRASARSNPTLSLTELPGLMKYWRPTKKEVL